MGVAAIDAAAGSVVTLAVEGIFDIAKNPPDALTACSVAMIDPATGIVSLAGTAAIGWIVQAAAASATTARVRLCPSVAGALTVAESSAHHDHPPKHARAGRGRDAKRH